MKKFTLRTPYADVEVLIKDEDDFAAEEIEEWVCEKTGTHSRKHIQAVLEAFDEAKKRNYERTWDFILK